jgi:drug/metabolite transporter (DMT)-like permease
LAPLFLKERSSRWLVLGLLVATVGAGCVAVGAGTGGRGLNVLGLAAGVASGVLSGAAITSVRSLRQSTDAFTVYFAFCALGLVFSLAPAMASWSTLSPQAWWLVLAMSVVSLIGQLLYTYAMGFTETVPAGVVNQLAPVFSFAMAVLFLGDRPQMLTLTGAVLCIAGVLLGLRVA